MRLIAKLIVAVLLNALGLWLAASYISGFRLSPGLRDIAVIAGVLALLNFFVKPVLKLLLGPIIVLTLGLGILFVNALILYILDILAQNLTIETALALFYATLTFSALNLLFHLATKSKS